MKKSLLMLIVISLANAGLLSSSVSSLERDIKNQAGSALNKEFSNYTGAKKTIIKDILKGTDLKNLPGISGLDSFINSISFGYVNLKCLKPKFQTPKLNICSLDFTNKFDFKIGPCQTKAVNPMKKLYDDLCSKKKKNSVTSNPANVNFLDGLTSSLAKGASLGNIYTPQGIKYSDIYGSEDGTKPSFYANLAKTNPSSPVVANWINNNKKILILQDKTIKEKGTTDLAKFTLPKTKGQWLKQVYSAAKSYSNTVPDYLGIYEEISSKLTQKFANITGSTLGNIRSQEFNYWYQLTQESEIKNIYNVVGQSYDSYYANKLLLLNAKSKYYLYSPTQDYLQYIPDSEKTGKKYKALIYTAQVVNLMAKKEIQKKKTKENISLVLKAAYISSLDFRKNIAQKEIETLVNSVK